MTGILTRRAGGQRSPATVVAPGFASVFFDDYSTDRIAAEYTLSHAVYSVTGGVLQATAPGAVTIAYVTGLVAGDTRVTLQQKDMCMTLCVLDTSNFLFMKYDGAEMVISKRDAGATTTLLVGTAHTHATTDYKRFVKVGNVLTAEHFTADPYGGATVVDSETYTLTGANATKFGAGITGSAGVANNQGFTVTGDNLRIESQ